MPNDTWDKRVARAALALVMGSAGVLHFAAEPLFAQIVPSWLPAPRALVLVSGACEVGLAALLLVSATRRLAGYGLVALYIAVFPANIYMAVDHVQLRGAPAWLAHPSSLALWLRLPLQLVFIGWALWVSRPARPSSPRGRASS